MKSDRDKFLVAGEFRRLLAAARGTGAPAMRRRNYVLLCLAGNLGLRVGESVALRTSDVHLDRRPPFLRVRTLKQRRERLDDLPLDKSLATVLSAYIREYHVGQHGDAALFPASWKWPSESIKARTGQWVFQRAAAAAGLSSKYSFHSLRHYRGLRLWQESGGDGQVVQRLMRHGSMTSSLVYAHLDPERLAAVNARVSSIT